MGQVEREAHKCNVQLDIDVCASRKWLAGLSQPVRDREEAMRVNLTAGVWSSG